MSPAAVAPAVSAPALEAERAILREQALASGKKPQFVDRIVEGRLAKFYEEQCLLDQKFVMDDKQTVQVPAGQRRGPSHAPHTWPCPCARAWQSVA